MTTACVSGAQGFIGKHLIKILQDNNIEVFPLKRDDLNNPVALEVFMKDYQPDYIFHLSAYGNHYNQKDEDETLTANVVKTYFMLKACRFLNFKAFVNFSSSSVYGTKKIPMKEEHSLDTDTFYGCTKVCGEYLTKAFAKKYKLPYLNVRPFSIYGIGEKENRFIPTVIRSLLDGKTIKLAEEPVHDWLYVNELLIALLKVVEHAKDFIGESINIGTGTQYTNKQVVEMLEKISGKKCKIKKVKFMRNYDSDMWVADTMKLKLLGWKPQYSLEEGLTQVYKYYENIKLEGKRKLKEN